MSRTKKSTTEVIGTIDKRVSTVRLAARPVHRSIRSHLRNTYTKLSHEPRARLG
jgi:hypothetical protein